MRLGSLEKIRNVHHPISVCFQLVCSGYGSVHHPLPDEFPGRIIGKMRTEYTRAGRGPD